MRWLAGQEAGARVTLDGMRRAVPQRYGTDRLQGGELEVPAGPPGRQRAFGDRAELADGGELAVGGAQDPQVLRGQG